MIVPSELRDVKQPVAASSGSLVYKPTNSVLPTDRIFYEILPADLPKSGVS